LPIIVAIIGAGPLGRWLALAAARAGYRVALEDVMPGNLRRAQDELRTKDIPIDIPGLKIETLRQAQGRLWGTPGKDIPGTQENDLSSPGESRGGISLVSTIEDAVREADLAIDCVPDELESKLEIFCLLDRMAPPRTVLMTPTTRLSIADLASCTYRAERCVAIAAEAAELTEGAQRALTIRTTAKTDTEVVEMVREFWERLGFVVRLECEM
jgi:3-hydroxybutyryl-CoA dehydrogenase